MKNTKKIAALLALSMVLSQGVINAKEVPTKKTSQSEKQVVLKSLDVLKPINISQGSSVKLTDINILTQDNENILTYTLTYTNKGSKDLSLIDFWSKVKSKNGSAYTSNILTKDKEKKKVSPQSSISITYYSKVGKTVSINDLKIELVKWDFNMPGYEKQLGVFTIPSDVSTATIANKSKRLLIQDVPVNSIIDSANVYATNEYKYVSVSLRLKNVGYKTVNDPKYKFYIKTADGASYPVDIDSSGVDYKVQPQENKVISLMTKIPAKMNTDKLQLQIIQEEETAKIDMAIATYQIPKAASENVSVGENEGKTINVSNTKLNFQVTSASMSINGDKKAINTTIKIKNTGSQSITVPKYTFTYLTKDGKEFTIQTKALDNVTINPLSEKTIRLTGEVPSYIDITNLQLCMNQAIDTTQKDKVSNYPIAIFKVPSINVNDNTIGKEYMVDTDKASFGVTLSAVQRLPWVDGDVVSAKVTIKNYKFNTIELPKLDGILNFDNIKATDGTKLVQTNKSVFLGANQSVQAYIVTKIPYGMDYQNIEVYLMEKIADDNANELIQFTQTGSFTELNTIKNGEVNQIATAGREAEVKVRKTQLYPGVGSNIIYTEVEMKSLEKRQAEMSQLVGFFKSKDGQYFKATVSQVDRATSPEGKNLVTLWAKIPKNMDSSNMNLIIGEGVTDDKMTPVKGEATAYVNASKYELVQESNQYKNVLANIDLFPYTFNVNNISGYALGSSIKIDLDYNLKRDNSYEIGAYEHKLIMEIQDSSGKSSEKELTLETGDLKLGNNKLVSMNFDGSDVSRNSNSLFTVVLYDQYQGERIKLASQSFYFSSVQE